MSEVYTCEGLQPGVIAPKRKRGGSAYDDWEALNGSFTTPMERIAIWQEHCRRVQRSEDKGWAMGFVLAGLVLAFFTGFAAAAVGLVRL